MPGIGAMLGFLRGNHETVEAINACLNKKISSASIDDSEIILGFEDGTNLSFFDDGQSCCESRYMRTDDDIQSLVGHKFIGAEGKEAPDMPDEYGDHEVEFLEIKSDGGSIVISNHNEHNGYYGGFDIVVRLK